MVCLIDCVAKVIVVVFSIIISLLSLGIIAGAVYAMTNDVMKEFVDEGFMIGIIVVGVIFFFIGILGCKAARRGRNLVSAIIFMIVVLLGVIAFVILSGIVKKYTNATNSFLETKAFAIPYRNDQIYTKIQDTTYTSLRNNFDSLFEASKCAACTATGRSSSGVPTFTKPLCPVENVQSILDELAKTPETYLDYVSYEACRSSISGETILLSRVTASASALQLIDAGLDTTTMKESTQSVACWCRSNRKIFDELHKAGGLLASFVLGIVGVLAVVWLCALILRRPQRD